MSQILSKVGSPSACLIDYNTTQKVAEQSCVANGALVNIDEVKITDSSVSVTVNVNSAFSSEALQS